MSFQKINLFNLLSSLSITIWFSLIKIDCYNGKIPAEMCVIAVKQLITNKRNTHWGIQNEREMHTLNKYIRDICGTRNRTGIKGHFQVAGLSCWSIRQGRERHSAERDQGYWVKWHEHRNDIALWNTQSIPAMDIQGRKSFTENFAEPFTGSKSNLTGSLRSLFEFSPF